MRHLQDRFDAAEKRIQRAQRMACAGLIATVLTTLTIVAGMLWITKYAIDATTK